jgi:hypothetical protein
MDIHALTYKNKGELGNLFNNFGNWLNNTFNPREADRRDDAKEAIVAENWQIVTEAQLLSNEHIKSEAEVQKSKLLAIWEVQKKIAIAKKQPEPLPPVDLIQQLQQNKTKAEQDITEKTVYKNQLLLNEQLGINEFMRSENGYRLVFQEDGNLVLYRTDGVALWSSNTQNKGANRVSFQQDGNLVIYTPDNRVVWATNTHGRGANRLSLQEDGNLVIYTSNNQAIWATR